MSFRWVMNTQMSARGVFWPMKRAEKKKKHGAGSAFNNRHQGTGNAMTRNLSCGRGQTLSTKTDAKKKKARTNKKRRSKPTNQPVTVSRKK